MHALLGALGKFWNFMDKTKDKIDASVWRES
jgi:hypothetical protein